VRRRTACSMSIGLALCLQVASGHVNAAEDLGTRGQVYSPGKDGREQLKDQIRQKQASGELDRFWQDYRSKTLDSIRNPRPLGVPVDLSPRVELRELRWTVPVDWRDQQGRVVAQRGTVIEPLKRTTLRHGLIFIDGRDEAQVDYALARGRREQLKIVLVAGSPLTLRERYAGAGWWSGPNVPFFFDQRRMILDQLQRMYGIKLASVPVVMSQAGDKLRLEYGLPSGGANAQTNR